ncbi:unnamed protein product, partial [Ectocarpus sp. 4 AP-2014]
VIAGIQPAALDGRQGLAPRAATAAAAAGGVAKTASERGTKSVSGKVIDTTGLGVGAPLRPTCLTYGRKCCS